MIKFPTSNLIGFIHHLLQVKHSIAIQSIAHKSRNKIKSSNKAQQSSNNINKSRSRTCIGHTRLNQYGYDRRARTVTAHKRLFSIVPILWASRYPPSSKSSRQLLVFQTLVSWLSLIETGCPRWTEKAKKGPKRECRWEKIIARVFGGKVRRLQLKLTRVGRKLEKLL